MNSLQANVLQWYARSGRAELPWRATRDPYRILVSEFMLQQTQVDRVLPKYRSFIERFADFKTLAQASTADVLRQWKGLGYNSRAIRLQGIARIVERDFAGKMPMHAEQLLAMPGIGPYTAAALRAFAFEEDDLALDTNIRRVMRRVLYGLAFEAGRSERTLEAQSLALTPSGRAHDWNSALMDLGATVCTARAPQCSLCPLRNDCAAAPLDAVRLESEREAHRKKRSPQESIPFEQTTRFARGRIVDRLRGLPAGRRISLLDLQRDMQTVLPAKTLDSIEETLGALERDGIVRRDGESFALPE
ncbi:MAG: A/G-specific adenine glycosylase [Candidatus Eremiobacteraeota bacterium]|nr:A/G-specific adenine glycosylase [Candidatus Eremiobacteraeota bacterium]